MPLVEKRYAEALINISVEQNAIDTYQRDLETVERVYLDDPFFMDFLLNPENETGIKKSVVQKVFEGNVKPELISFLKLLLDKGRIKHLPGIYKEFVQFADEKRSILNISIMSAKPLDTAQLNNITEKFRKLYNASSVKSETKIDPSLIGGVKIAIGDKLIDGSIKGKLKALEGLLVK
jgi:ATP synthase, F1 delta subunit